VTGVSSEASDVVGKRTTLNTELEPKRLELMHELMPTTSIIALLVNPTSLSRRVYQEGLAHGAVSRGLELQVLNASTEHELDTAFANLRQLRVGGLVFQLCLS
jgi:putative tryptophan/tyrosine transport system substrate-binding protein